LIDFLSDNHSLKNRPPVMADRTCPPPDLAALFHAEDLHLLAAGEQRETPPEQLRDYAAPGIGLGKNLTAAQEAVETLRRKGLWN
jgi:hypothetical protein